jgi:competence protein ComEC
MFAAFGAASAFYGLFPLYHKGFIGIVPLLVLAFVPVAVCCLFRVLASSPLVGSQSLRFVRLASLRSTAFVAGLFLGIGAGSAALASTSFGIPLDSVTGVVGVLLDDPRLISGGKAMSTLSLKAAMGQGGVRTSAHGEVTVFFKEESAGRLQEFGRGAEVFIEGTLAAGTGGFEGTHQMSATALHVTKPAPPMERFRTNLRLALTHRFTRSPSGDPTWGGMSIALLLGIRDSLDASITSQYRYAGCSYLLALSGMHLAVIIGIISFLLKKPLGLRAAAIVGACVIATYCFIVGPLPSLSRSALMYLLGVFAILGMLKRETVSVLCITFLMQLAAAPQSGFSLSFILSYLGLLGIIVIGKWLTTIFDGMVPAFFLQPLAVSVGAFITTAGVSAWVFNDLRPIGILAGILLTPLTTLFMVVSLGWLGVDMLFPSLSFLLGKPLSLMYWLMEKIALTASYVPGLNMSPYMVITLSLLVIVLLALLEYRRRKITSRLDAFA